MELLRDSSGSKPADALVLVDSEMMRPQAVHNRDAPSPQRTLLQRTLSTMDAGSQRASMFGLVSTSMGSALLSTPSVFANLGLILGSVVLFFTGLATFLGLQVLARAAEATSSNTYGGMVKKSIGGLAAAAADVIFMMYGLFTALGCYIFLKQLIPQFARNIGIPEQVVSSDIAVLGTLTVFPILPLCLLKTLSALRYMSLLAVIFSLLTILIFCFVTPVKFSELMRHSAEAQVGSAESLPASWWLWPNSKQSWLQQVPLALAICLFALTNHVNLFQTRTELARPLPRRVDKVIARAAILQTFIYWLAGVLCFLSLGPPCDKKVPDAAWPSCTPVNVLTAPRFHDVASTMAQGFMIFIVIASIVLNLGAGRRAFFQLLGRWRSKGAIEVPASSDINGSTLNPNGRSWSYSDSTACHVATTVLSVGAIMLAGTYLNSLDSILSILGGFCVASYGAAIPVIAMISLRRGVSAGAPLYSEGTQTLRSFVLTAMTLSISSAIGYFSVVQTIIALLSGEESLA